MRTSLQGLLKALDMLDEVISTIRSLGIRRCGPRRTQNLADIDDDQARAILLMQLRQLAALERQNIQDEYDELQTKIAEYMTILDL